MIVKDKAIGVFDSGLGGISVLKELKAMMPNENYIYYGDSSFAPYGVKSREEITARCKSICQLLMEKGVKAIVIACNTATSACVNELRIQFPSIPIIGMEPALKVAVDQKPHQNVLVMATSFTLREKKFHDLMARYGEHHEIYRLPAGKLVELVENGRLKETSIVMQVLKEYFQEYDMKQMDSIVLGCTHFVFFKEEIRAIVGSNIALIDGNLGTSRHVWEVLKERGSLQDSQTNGTLELLNSSDELRYIEIAEELLAL